MINVKCRMINDHWLAKAGPSLRALSPASLRMTTPVALKQKEERGVGPSFSLSLQSPTTRASALVILSPEGAKDLLLLGDEGAKDLLLGVTFSPGNGSPWHR